MLDQLDLTTRTVVALTADHGESFGEHTDFEAGGIFFQAHGLHCTELRTPLLLRHPGRIRPGTVVPAVSQAIDLLPTLLDLAGLPTPAQVHAMSLLGLLTGTDDGRGRAAFAAMPDDAFTAVTTAGWKLLRDHGSGQWRLVDLWHDPGERRDLLTARADVAAILTAWLGSSRAPSPSPRGSLR